MVEMSLPRFSPSDKFLWVLVEIRISRYSESSRNNDIERGCSFNLLFHRNSNYTKVLFYKNTFECSFDYYNKSFPIDNWILKAEHDSCWRDGVERIINDMEDELFKGLDKYDRKISKYVSFGLTEPKLLKGTIERNNDDRFERGYYNIQITGEWKQ